MSRHRFEKLAFAKMLAALLRPITGMSQLEATKVLADYGEELLQLTYTYGYQSIRERLGVVKKKAVSEDMERLARVAKLSGD